MATADEKLKAWSAGRSADDKLAAWTATVRKPDKASESFRPLMAQKALESPSLPLAVKRSLEPKAAPASKSSNGVGGKAASSYLTGGTSTPATPYGAGLQAGIAKTPERKETPKAVPLPSEPAPQKLDKGPRLRKEIALDWAKRIEQQPMLSGGLVAPEENKAFIRQLNKELEADDMLAMGLDPRWAALTRKQGLLTDEEKDEASAAALQLATQPLQVRYQEAHQEAGASPYGQIPAMLRFERSMTPEEKKLFKAQTALRSAAADRSGVSAPSAAAMGLVSSLPGATWADREGAKAQREMTPKPFRSPLTPEGWSPYTQARAEHPIAYGGGAVAGNVGMALLGGQVANAAVRTAPVLRNLPKAAQAVISTGLNFGTRGALQTAENGGDAGEIIQSGVTNALTGMAGQGVGQVVNLGAAKLLDHLGLKNSIPANVAASGAEGVAFAGTQMGTRMLLDEDYRPTAGEAVQDLTTAAAFSAISRLIQTHAQSKAAAARLQTDVDDMRRDFARIVGNEPINGMGATLDDLAVKVARTRAAINTNIYMGQQDTVNAINEFLDTLDDAIAMKRMELGTVPGTAVDASAAVGGGSIAPIRVGRATTIQHPYSGPVPTFYESMDRITPSIDTNAIKVAQNRINQARAGEQQTGKSFRNVLTDIYELLFQNHGGKRTILMPTTYMEGEPYLVTLNKSAIGKVISDANVTPQKLAVLDVIDEVVAQGEYVGSGQYIPHGTKKKQTVRYDYFETPVTIGDSEYIVAFDVEIFPNVNNYRTHKVINEMDIIPVGSDKTGTHQPQNTIRADVGTHQPQGMAGQYPSTSKRISHPLRTVNPQSPTETPSGQVYNTVIQGRKLPTLPGDIPADIPPGLHGLYRLAQEMSASPPPREIPQRPVQQSPQEILSQLAWKMAMGPQAREIPQRPVQQSPQEILTQLAQEMTQDPAQSGTLSLPAQSDEKSNPIENSGQYDILEETGYSIQPITEESIQKVALVQPHGLSKVQAKQLQDAHKKLLHSVMGKPAGTEACALYSVDMSAEIDYRVGEEDGQSVSIPRCAIPHIAIHNHPDNNVFSLRDLVTFLQNDKMKGITAICNSGKVFSLSKAEDYDGFLFWRDLESVLPLLDDAVERQDIDEYVDIITKLLQRSSEYGVEFIEG